MSDIIGWQSIDTAPKDGTWILLKGGAMDSRYDRIGIGAPPCVVALFSKEHDDEYSDSDGPWRFASYDGGLYGGYVSPTHWMPLP